MSGQQLANAKYRNWVKAALGFKYVKEGLAPFCDDIVRQQHADILNNVKQRHNMTTAKCSQCNLRTLKPNHVRMKDRQCPLGQKDCNCQHPGRTVACSNNICGAIYDDIINLHASTPASPYWKNTDVKLWCSQPWAIAKCFINAPGYSHKSAASEIDCSGLLHVLINNKGLQRHMHCTITGSDVFSKVRQHRNIIFHSENMEIDAADVVTYIDDMIAVLQDSKELKHRNESKSAVQELMQLKQHDFIITASLEAEVKAAKTALTELHKELGQKFKDEMEQKGLGIISEIEQKGSDVKAEMDQKGSDVKTEVNQTGSNIKADVAQKCSEVKTVVDQKGSEVKAEVDQKGSDVMAMIDQKGSDVMAKMEQTGKRMMHQLQETSSRWSETDKESRYTELKIEFQTRLVKLYNDQVIKISPLPLLQHENFTDIVDIYVPPLMTIERQAVRQSMELQGQSREHVHETQSREVEVSVHDIFKIEGKPAKLIYVLGEAGSGKSSFCKYLVTHWCVAHSGQSCRAADKNLVEEMKNFLYLFYFSLRHLSDYHSIKDMLKEVYQDDILDKVLQNESKTCLIVLDGLDEWTPQGQKSSQFATKGLPYRDPCKDYTILTTSRPWKCCSLQIKKSEMDQTIKLKGIDEYSAKLLINKTVNILNKKFQKMKHAYICSTDIEEGSFSEIRRVPMLLQHLTCLWFDDKLKDTSKCAVYSSMIELFFEWAAQKDAECEDEENSNTSNEVTGLELPECLTDFEACRENKQLINSLSQLAYETLFVKSKENAFTFLTFTSSTLKRLKIPNDIKTRSLHIGILSEDRAITLHASRRQQSSFSFIHKSVQEYMAAVFIAIQYENRTKRLTESDHNHEIGMECLINYLGSCRTVDDILAQSNVFIMLSGLKPHLAACITKYIYDIVAVDGRVENYRSTLDQNEISDKECNNEQLIYDIQSCIMSCLNEAKSTARSFQPRIYIGDIIMSAFYSQPDEITLDLDKKNIVLDSVTSLYFRVTTSLTECDIETLIHCRHLKCLRYFKGGICINTRRIDNNNIFAVIMVNNLSTLQVLDIPSCEDPVLQHLPNMHKLISLRLKEMIGVYRLSHEQCVSLSTWITQNTRLREISVYIKCDHGDIHVVNISNHQQIQHIDLFNSIVCAPKLNSDKLVTCIVSINDTDETIQMLDSLYKASNLRHLQLSIRNMESAVAEWQNVTESVIRLLPSLTSLSTLGLLRFTFTDIIFTCPADMKNLKQITFLDAVMSMTTWCKFIDCLPEIPQTVHVDTYGLNITPDGNKCNMRYCDKHQANETAYRYVSEKTSLFHVTWKTSVDLKCFTLKSECNS